MISKNFRVLQRAVKTLASQCSVRVPSGKHVVPTMQEKCHPERKTKRGQRLVVTTKSHYQETTKSHSTHLPTVASVVPEKIPTRCKEEEVVAKGAVKSKLMPGLMGSAL